MISLPLKQGEKVDIVSQILKIAEAESGPHIAKKIKLILQKAQNLREKLFNLTKLKDNQEHLDEVANDIQQYISMWNSISRGLIFGKDEECVNILFVWKDAFTKDKKKSYNPITERIAMLYNLMVVYNQKGICLLNSLGVDLKEAVNAFLIAAWIVSQIESDVTHLKSEDITLDIEESSLNMYSALMKGQAQSLLYKKLLATKSDKNNLLSKLSMQAAIYYKEAQNNGMLGILNKAPGKTNLINTMKFYEHYFIARAYYHSALDLKARNDEKLIKIAMGNIKYANEHIKSLEKIVPAEEAKEFKIFVEECADKKRIVDNHGKLHLVFEGDKHGIIEGLAYGKLVSIEAELNRPIEGNDLLLRLISPEVKDIKEEYEREVGYIRKEVREQLIKTDKDMENFKEKCKKAFKGITNGEFLWDKIEQCKDKCDVEELQQKIKSTLKDIERIVAQLLNLKAKLQKEEQEDQKLRSKHGAAWNIPPSNEYNGSSLKQIEKQLYTFGLQAKSSMALLNKINEKKEELKLLDMNREELLTKIPKGHFTALPSSAFE